MTKAASAAQSAALARLQDAFQSKDRDEVEAALVHAWSAGLHVSMGDALIRLAEAPWHTRHEDVVRGMQQLRYGPAVPALELMAHAAFDYLAYDNFFGLARKCTWALADIGTPEALSALERLSQSGNPLIAGYARKRIDRWQDELARKSERTDSL